MQGFKTLNKSLIVLTLGFLLSLATSFSVYAYEEIDFEESGTIVRIDIPQEDGTYKSLFGKEAGEWYDSMESCEEIDQIPQKPYGKLEEMKYKLLKPLEMFTYRYRYVEEKRTKDVRRDELKRNVTHKLENYSSVAQNYSINLEVLQSWTINSEVSGKYKDAVVAKLGNSWCKSYKKIETLNMVVPPKKSLQVKFIPIMDKSEGKVQKYFITGGPIKREHIESSKKVVTYSPKYLYVNIGNKTVQSVYGIYVWEERRL